MDIAVSMGVAFDAAVRDELYLWIPDGRVALASGPPEPPLLRELRKFLADTFPDEPLDPAYDSGTSIAERREAVKAQIHARTRYNAAYNDRSQELDRQYRHLGLLEKWPVIDRPTP